MVRVLLGIDTIVRWGPALPRLDPGGQPAAQAQNRGVTIRHAGALAGVIRPVLSRCAPGRPRGLRQPPCIASPMTRSDHRAGTEVSRMTPHFAFDNSYVQLP